VAVFICPSESLPAFDAYPYTSYAGNYGSVYAADGDSDGPFKTCFFTWPGSWSRDVMDGLSQTSLFSEWLTGNENDGPELGRSSREEIEVNPAETHDEFAARCRSQIGMKRLPGHRRGRYWYNGHWTNNLYDHGVPPNLPFCSKSPKSILPIPSGLYVACSAGSMHPGGANVVFADAHVRMVRDSIQPADWRALGSIAGGEAISAEAY